MKITTTKDGTVSFLQMNPDLAKILVDMAHDLSEGLAVIYRSDPQGDIYVLPKSETRDQLRLVGKAYERPTVRIDSKHWDAYWSAYKDLDEQFIQTERQQT